MRRSRDRFGPAGCAVLILIPVGVIVWALIIWMIVKLVT